MRAEKASALPAMDCPAGDAPPGWAVEWAHAGAGTGARLLTIRQPLGSATEGSAVEQLTADAYARLLRRIADEGDWHPVRIWNFVPSLLADSGEGLNRYMRFNVGRHRAFREWLGSEKDFDEKLPAASAVGTDSDELVIHALVLRTAGTAVHNPRQHAPYRYSRRFGPLPPCFARATSIEDAPGGRALLVGGTASVRGEDSVHPGRVDLQLEETILNLEAVARAAFDVPHGQALTCYREVRVYHPHREDETAIRRALAARLSAVRQIEFVVADLCRPELLVEIEGLARDTASASPPRN